MCLKYIETYVGEQRAQNDAVRLADGLLLTKYVSFDTRQNLSISFKIHG